MDWAIHKPRPAPPPLGFGFGGAEKAGENLFLFNGAEADTGVGDADSDLLVVSLQGEGDTASGLSIFDGIIHQIEEQPLQMLPIRRNKDWASVTSQCRVMDFSAASRCSRAGDFKHQLCQIHRLQVEAQNPGIRSSQEEQTSHQTTDSLNFFQTAVQNLLIFLGTPG